MPFYYLNNYNINLFKMQNKFRKLNNLHYIFILFKKFNLVKSLKILLNHIYFKLNFFYKLL